MKWIMLFAFVGLSNWASGTVTVGSVACPHQFKGKIQEIIEDIGPSSAFSTHKVVFKNLETVKGEVGKQVIVDVLKHGPFKVEPGEEYQVQLRNGKICWLEQI